MVSLAARSAIVGFPEHTSALILIRYRLSCECAYVYANGEWNLRRIDISFCFAQLFILLEFIGDEFVRESPVN